MNELNRIGMPWKESEDNAVHEMLEKNVSIKKIAQKLGRTPRGVVKRLSLLNGRMKPASNTSDAENAEIARLHIDGLTSKEICNATGRSDRTVARVSRIADSVLSYITEKGTYIKCDGDKLK